MLTRETAEAGAEPCDRNKGSKDPATRRLVIHFLVTRCGPLTYTDQCDTQSFVHDTLTHTPYAHVIGRDETIEVACPVRRAGEIFCRNSDSPEGRPKGSIGDAPSELFWTERYEAIKCRIVNGDGLVRGLRRKPSRRRNAGGLKTAIGELKRGQGEALADIPPSRAHVQKGLRRKSQPIAITVSPSAQELVRSPPNCAILAA